MGTRIFQYPFYSAIAALLIFAACVEEIDVASLGSDGSEGLLVVEAVLTNERVTQKVYLSRSDVRLDLETDQEYNPNVPTDGNVVESVLMEAGAQVRLIGENGNVYPFTEGTAGIYLSNEQFALDLGVSYQLEITTVSGLDYVSDPIRVEGISQMTQLYAEKATNEAGEEGIAIYVDSEAIDGEVEFLKFTYEETYKVIAPYWAPQEFVLTDYDPCALPVPTYDLQIKEREIQNRVCYNTLVSNTIDQLGLSDNPDGKVSRKRVRFIGKDNYIISHRYSILVRQQVQSADAYSFYSSLKSFSQSGSIFSQVQPGALYANVRRADGSDETVLGYVEAVGVSEQRLFFDFEDFFPGEQLPAYPFNCDFATALESHKSYCISNLDSDPCPLSVIERVNEGLISYYAPYDESLVPSASCPGPHVFVPRICGDCTLLGDNVVPEFWEE